MLFINNWATPLTNSAGTSATALSVSPAEAAKLGTIGAGEFYTATLAKVDEGAETAWEIVHITEVAGGTLTVERAQEGTTALTWSAGEVISVRLTAAGLASGSAPVVDIADTTFFPGAQHVGKYLRMTAEFSTIRINDQETADWPDGAEIEFRCAGSSLQIYAASGSAVNLYTSGSTIYTNDNMRIKKVADDDWDVIGNLVGGD